MKSLFTSYMQGYRDGIGNTFGASWKESCCIYSALHYFLLELKKKEKCTYTALGIDPLMQLRHYTRRKRGGGGESQCNNSLE